MPLDLIFSQFLQGGGGVRIDGSADLTDCNIHDNKAWDSSSYTLAVSLFCSNRAHWCSVPYDPALR